MAYLPLFGQNNFPSNANIFNDHLLDIANFDIVNTEEWVDPHIYGEFPEKEPYRMSFERTGVESTLLLANVSVLIWMIVVHTVFILAIYIPVWLISRTCGKLESWKQKIADYFFWGGLLRLLMEVFLDLILACILNVYMMDWRAETLQEIISNYVSLTILGLLALILPSLAIYLTCNLDAFKYEEFLHSYDAVLEGMQYEELSNDSD